jgi:transcriptional regulator with XRE-family HTH domain
MLQRIRDLREDNDLKQNDLANILKITQSTYSKYERGARDIPTDILIRLADFYETSVDYLLGRTDEIKPYPKA